jgi:hypothetical protein
MDEGGSSAEPGSLQSVGILQERSGLIKFLIIFLCLCMQVETISENWKLLVIWKMLYEPLDRKTIA